MIGSARPRTVDRAVDRAAHDSLLAAQQADEDDTDPSDVLDSIAATDIRLYDATDLPWIAMVVDQVMSCLGQPWRVLRERLEHAPIRGARVAAILGAMRRLMEGRAQRTKVARKVRQVVLGPPALTDEARAERLARAGEELGIDPADIEGLLWIDLADERPVALPQGRPDEQRLAAYANVDRIQRALRRARHVRVHAWGNALPLIRIAARYGLLVRVSSSETASTSPMESADDDDAVTRSPREPRDVPGGDHLATRSPLDPHHVPVGDHRTARDAPTVLDIVGPLSLFHRTQVYGHSLGAIVPYLSALDRFIVEIDADLGYGMAALRVTSPAMLPPAPEERGKPSIATKLASALERTRDVIVERDPPPIVHGTERLFPDLALEVLGPIAAPPPRERDGRDIDERAREADSDLVPDLAALLAAHMNDAADRIASRSRPRREREPGVVVPARMGPDRSRCWFVEVVGFATTEYLRAKLARYAAAGIERVVLVVDDTRDAALADVRRVVPYSRTVITDLLGILAETT